MVEHLPPQKADEEYPLLKVEGGGGDNKAPTPPAPAAGWSVSCSKRSWIDRWPELFSACWMSGMLLGIFVLIAYGLGTLGVIRKSPIYVINCNGTRPASEVHLHHIVQRRGHVPFNRFSEYLSFMASLYPALHFNVIFLMDDALQHGLHESRHSRLLDKLFPYYTNKVFNDDTIGRELRDFHVKYHNVNVTIMPLAKYMASTPLRYKWRSIPPMFLIFYIRVHSVWKTGGIGMDLDIFSNHHKMHIVDRRITGILKQHNDGIKPDEYTSSLTKIDRGEQNEFVSLFYGMIHQILNETRDFLNKTHIFSQDLSEKPSSKTLIRAHRSKRDSVEDLKNASNTTVRVMPTERNVNTTDITIIDAAYQNTDHALTVTNNNLLTMFGKIEATKNTDKIVNGINGESQQLNNSELKVKIPLVNDLEPPQYLLFYNVLEGVGPSYFIQDSGYSSNASRLTEKESYNEVTVIPAANESKQKRYFLSITSEGSFVAASSKQHPFLGHIISSRCQQMPPWIAIEDAIMTQCSSLFNDDVYCGNIFIL